MIYPAMAKWTVSTFGTDPNMIGAWMFSMLEQNPSRENVIWQYLEATGDDAYSRQSFVKAAALLIEESELTHE